MQQLTTILTRDALKRLIHEQDSYCVSVFMSVQPSAAGERENDLKLKNLLREAEHLLVKKGCEPARAEKLLRPLQVLRMEHALWSSSACGLALFISELTQHVYQLPLPLSELVMVEPHYHIRPLLPLLSGDGCFYVLALSQHAPRLLQCTRYAARNIGLPGLVPIGHIEPELSERHIEPHVAARSAGPVGVHGAAMRFYGRGDVENTTKDALTEYCRELHRAVQRTLRDEHAPLILAGGPVLLPLFQEINRYPYLRHNVIEINPDTQSDADLQHNGWELVGPEFNLNERILRERYQQFTGTRRVSNSLRSIIHNAMDGRVEVLFVAKDGQSWGKVDPEMGTIAIHSERRPYSEDLLDVAAAYTLLNNGTVYVEAASDVPGGESASALLRY